MSSEILYFCIKFYVLVTFGDMETPQHGNASKKRTHKTNLMSSSLIKKKFFNNYFTINLG